MKVILIVVGIVGVIGALVVVYLLLKFGQVVSQAHGQALYSSVGAWTRIKEFAHAEGKSNYIAEADSKLALLENDLKAWRAGAVSTTDFGVFEKMKAAAYETTDRNIKNGQNPLVYLDAANVDDSNGGLVGKAASTAVATQVETPLGVEVATMPHDCTAEELKRFREVFSSNQIPCNLVGDPVANHAYIPREHVSVARSLLLLEQQRGLKVTLK